MDLAVIITVFAVILPAELPDKSMVAALILGTRYRPVPVYLGVASAFAVHVCIAVVAGALLARLPKRPLEFIVGLLFLVGAALILKEHGSHDPASEKIAEHIRGQASFWRIVGMGFVVIFIPEFGDLTQIATANLVAKFHNPLSVGIGALLALWTAGAIGVWGGRSLLRVIPVQLFARLAALLLATLGLGSLIAAFHG